MLKPIFAQSWSYERAAHLLSRAGFGGTPEEIEATHAKGLDAAVTDLIEAPDKAAETPPPTWAHPQNIRDLRMRLRMADGSDEKKERRRQFRQTEGENILDLRRWWLEQMSRTTAPLLEKMTLFWHGHFATSDQKVKNGYWMWLQNDTLRRNALGNFATLTKQISRDPAMMIYLDLQQSRPQHPNENWARELMELFTIGIGNYTEQDIRESARAFTGYRLDLTNQQFRFAPYEHDSAPKTFMGKSANFSGDDIIEILLSKPACARFVGRKIWRYFVEDEPAAGIVDAIAERLRDHKYEMRPLLRDIFSSAEFYSDRVMRAQIKSPVQFLVDTTRILETELPPAPVAQNAMRQMGQILFAPPNVKGWDGGKAWVSTSTLLFRYNFANYLINGDQMLPAPNAGRQKGVDLGFKRRALASAGVAHRAPIEVAKIIRPELREKPRDLVADLSKRIFPGPVPQKESDTFVQFLESRRPDTSDETMRGLLHLMMSTPRFQLT